MSSLLIDFHTITQHRVLHPNAGIFGSILPHFMWGHLHKMNNTQHESCSLCEVGFAGWVYPGLEQPKIFIKMFDTLHGRRLAFLPTGDYPAMKVGPTIVQASPLLKGSSECTLCNVMLFAIGESSGDD